MVNKLLSAACETESVVNARQVAIWQKFSRGIPRGGCDVAVFSKMNLMDVSEKLSLKKSVGDLFNTYTRNMIILKTLIVINLVSLLSYYHC